MRPSPRFIQGVYLFLLLCNTLSASLIWGINTLFLLDAGLSNTQAFLANACFTLGQVIFEVPTGVVADVRGRRLSYLLGTVTLAASTLMYLWAWSIHAGMPVWAAASILLGLGFTFFSGATEAWLVDALEYAGYNGELDSVFAKGQVVSGVAMLIGAVGGGVAAQYFGLAVPYILRAVLLLITTFAAFFLMKDWGFSPQKDTDAFKTVQGLLYTSVSLGWKRPELRWIVLAAPFTAGVGFYAFYAMQPFLLGLYQDETAYAVAGLAAAIVAGSQIFGGMLVPHLRRLFKKRTSLLIATTVSTAVILALLGGVQQFWIAVLLLCGWGMVGAVAMPVRQAYVHGMVPSKHRATMLSFDSLVGSSGGIVIQPVLGKVADTWSYGVSFLGAASIQILAVPFVLLSRKEHADSDRINEK